MMPTSLWPAYRHMLEQNNRESLCTQLPARITRVTWLVNASAWLQQDDHCTATWRDIQTQLINRIALEQPQVPTGQMIVAFDLAALLPLHVPLPVNVSPEDATLLAELSSKTNINNPGNSFSSHVFERISGRAMEACPLHHWQWLKYLGEHLQCPPKLAQLEVARCLVLPNFTAQSYVNVMAELWEWLEKVYNVNILTSLEADDYFIALLVRRIIAQQLVANPVYCKALPIHSSSRKLTGQEAEEGGRKHMHVDVSELTAPAVTRQPMPAEAFAQLLPFIVNALTASTDKTNAMVLVCPGPDTLARILIGVALAHQKRSKTTTMSLSSLPLKQCFLRLADNEASLLDVGHFYNSICTRGSSTKSHKQRPWQSVITWALMALFSKENEALATSLWNLRHEQPLFSAVGLEHALVAQWYFGAWQLRLVPMSDIHYPCPLPMLHAAQANNIEIPDFERLDAIVARVYSDPVDRLPLVYEKPVPFMLFGFHQQYKERLKYAVKKADGPEYYALLATMGVAKRRFYINMLHADNVFMLTCWTLDVL